MSPGDRAVQLGEPSENVQNAPRNIINSSNFLKTQRF
jgi:hypothetical protein